MWIWTVEGGLGVYPRPVQGGRGRVPSPINVFIRSINIQTFTELLLWVKAYSGRWDCRGTICSAVNAGNLESVSIPSFYK